MLIMTIHIKKLFQKFEKNGKLNKVISNRFLQLLHVGILTFLLPEKFINANTLCSRVRCNRSQKSARNKYYALWY